MVCRLNEVRPALTRGSHYSPGLSQRGEALIGHHLRCLPAACGFSLGAPTRAP